MARSANRTLALTLILTLTLTKAGKRRRMNIMVETSGRDIAMFRYIEQVRASVRVRVG